LNQEMNAMDQNEGFGYDGMMGGIGGATSSRGGARVPLAVALNLLQTGMGGLVKGYQGPNAAAQPYEYDPNHDNSDVNQDADALNTLIAWDGDPYLPDANLVWVGPDGQLNGFVGATDAANQTGAYDPMFQSALRAFQDDRGLVADGLIGPETRAVLAAALEGGAPIVNRSSPQHNGDMPIPPPPAPSPGPAPGPSPSPMVVSGMSTGKKIAIAGGVAAVVAAAYYFLKK
jgi:peptidoglycan hydrolase-like protein with peptidoglycan-binding domain